MKRECKELDKVFNYQGASVSYTQDFDALDQEIRQVLEPQLIETAEIGFKRVRSDDFAQDVKNHIRGGDLYVVEQDNVAKGFAMLEPFPKEGVIYIAGVVKRPEVASGIIEEVVKYHLTTSKSDLLVVRTQNDRVLEIVTNTCINTTAVDRKASPTEVDLLIRLGLVKVDSDIDIDYLIHRGYYGSTMIQDGIRRRSANFKIQSLTNRLDYFRGDAIYGIGYRS